MCHETWPRFGLDDYLGDRVIGIEFGDQVMCTNFWTSEHVELH